MIDGATSTSAKPVPGLSLPTELLFLIFKYCEEYDWPDDPKADSIPAPVYALIQKDFPTWKRVAKSSKQNICNIRLVCKQFRQASFASFAWILSDRIFRLTEVGLQDLQSIAAVEGLAPWIKALTFGSAIVSTPGSHFEEIVRSSVYNEELHRALSSIHQAWTQYRRLPHLEIMQSLKVSLQCFSQLHNFRMVVDDSPDYLGGWLTPEQREWIVTNFRPYTPCFDLYDPWFSPEYFYESCNLDTARDVLRGFSEIGGEVRDLKFSLYEDVTMGIFPSAFRYFLPETLCSLRLSIDWHHFIVIEGEEWSDCSGEFFRALGNIPNLQDLALYLTHHDFDVRWTKELFQTLEKTSKLRRIHFKGKWLMSPNSLVKFVEEHVPALRHLILEGCYLEGRLFATLHSLAALTQNRLEYLRMWHIYEQKSTIFPHVFDEVALEFPRSEWPNFTCETDFGPGFRFLPDSKKKNNNVLEGGKVGLDNDMLIDEIMAAAADDGATDDE